jgi:hypothetical protein
MEPSSRRKVAPEGKTVKPFAALLLLAAPEKPAMLFLAGFAPL